MKLYMAVTNDKYEIPIAVTENPVELERLVYTARDSSQERRREVCQSRVRKHEF